MRLSRAEIVLADCLSNRSRTVERWAGSACHEDDAALRDAVLRTAPQDGCEHLSRRAPVRECAVEGQGRSAGPPARRVNGKGRVGPP
jgi:hypothetical protein